MYNCRYSEEGAGAGTAGRKGWSIKHCLFALGVVVFKKYKYKKTARAAAPAHARATHATRATTRATHAHALAGS
jgi:hypothetical protein